MKQVLNKIHTVEHKENHIERLKIELDLELGRLFEAMQKTDEEKREKSLYRLEEIHMTLAAFNALP